MLAYSRLLIGRDEWEKRAQKTEKKISLPDTFSRHFRLRPSLPKPEKDKSEIIHLHKISTKAFAILHPAVLQALHICIPLCFDFASVYFRSPLGSSCVSTLATMLIGIPLPSSLNHVILGVSGPLARHVRVTVCPSSTDALLGNVVKTGKSVRK